MISERGEGSTRVTKKAAFLLRQLLPVKVGRARLEDPVCSEAL